MNGSGLSRHLASQVASLVSPPTEGTLAALEPLLAALIEAARTAHPTIPLDPPAFVDHLSARLPAGLDEAALLESLSSLRGGDLHLASSCARADAAALAVFESDLLPSIGHALRSLRIRGALVEDLEQEVRAHLLVGADGAPPRIASYGGRGDLRGWVRVAATRLAITFLRKGRLELTTAGPVAAAASPADDPELAHLKRHYREELAVSVREALVTLTARERNLLRQSVLRGLSIDEIGGLYSVHRATAARWVQSAREHLFAEARTRLAEKLRIAPDELQSVIRVLESRLDVTLGGLFQAIDLEPTG